MTLFKAESSGNAVVRPASLVAWLGVACMVAALLSGVLNGLWELARPSFTEPQLYAAAEPAQRWGHAVLELVKVPGFLGGLLGLFLSATKRGPVTKGFMVLAVIGGLFYAAVWIWLAVTARFTIVYVLGGMWFQMVAPVALGVAALSARRVSWWNGAWAIAVGLINSQIFPLLGPARALVVQGIIWIIFGYLVNRLGRMNTVEVARESRE